MSPLTDILRLPSYQPNWLTWLRREMAPFPGRDTMTIRLVVTIVLVCVISMTLQVPQLAFSAFFVFFVTKENRVFTLVTGVIMIVAATIATATSLLLFHLTFDYPELRIPCMAGLIFTGMFLSRVFVIGPLGFVIGFVAALSQAFSERAPDTEALVRNQLWLWMSLVYPIGLTILINQILLPADPWDVLVRALTQRLNTATTALKRIIKEQQAGGQTNPVLLELATRGSSPLLALLNFAESKDPQLKRRHTSLVAAIAASEHLLHATAAVELRQAQPLTANDLHCAQSLLTEISELKTILPAHNPTLQPRPAAVAKAALPQLRELQFAAESFRDGLIRYITEDTQPVAAKVKKSLFIADAFTNPSHVRFALKVTASAMICYLIYSGLNWPGLNTAFLTCCFIALENTGATIRRGWLRLIGCALGGLLGYLAIFFFIPHMESITALVLLTAAGAAIIGWISAGTDRISYIGPQAAFAFFLCIFQGFTPTTNFATVRDRLVGIVLGIVASSIILRYVWPEHAIDTLRATLARLLRSLGQLVLIPQTPVTSEAEKAAIKKMRGNIITDLDSTLRLSELVGIENIIVRNESGISVSELEQATANTQALCLMTTALLSKTKLEEWERLEPAVQQAETALRISAADRLQHVATFIEKGQPLKPDTLEATFAGWNHAEAQVKDNDRPRLVRRVVDQIQSLT
ncbi:MAG TPA: FUSC family protein [Verrucomicrobiae bacterium]